MVVPLPSIAPIMIGEITWFKVTELAPGLFGVSPTISYSRLYSPSCGDNKFSGSVTTSFAVFFFVNFFYWIFF